MPENEAAPAPAGPDKTDPGEGVLTLKYLNMIKQRTKPYRQTLQEPIHSVPLTDLEPKPSVN